MREKVFNDKDYAAAQLERFSRVTPNQRQEMLADEDDWLGWLQAAEVEQLRQPSLRLSHGRED